MIDNELYQESYEDLLGQYPDIHPDLTVGKNVCIGRHTIIGEGCVIGDDVVIGHHTVIEDFCIIEARTRIWHGCFLRMQTEIGKDCMIGQHVTMEGWHEIGDRVRIGDQVHLAKETCIEDDVFLGPCVCTTNTKRIVHGRDYSVIYDAPVFRRACRIGGGAMFLPGVVVGKNALVGVGSVVTKDVPDGEIQFGNPAIFRGNVNSNEILET